MTHTGLADTYRNEQYVSKSDFCYEQERQMLLLNFNNPDKGIVALNILKCLRHDLSSMIDYGDSLAMGSKTRKERK